MNSFKPLCVHAVEFVFTYQSVLQSTLHLHLIVINVLGSCSATFLTSSLYMQSLKGALTTN